MTASKPAQKLEWDLVERYLAAVKRRLPEAEAKDITAELREALTGRVEAEEERLGRALERAETATILKSFGSPPLVAARYSGREYLIGPGLYPYFWSTQRMVVGVVIAIAMVIAAVKGVALQDPVTAMFGALGRAWNAAIFTFGVVTVVFVVMETTKVSARFEAAWNPLRLPHEQVRKPRSLFESIISVAFDAAFIAWWAAVMADPQHRLHPGADVVFTAAWDAAMAPILVLGVMSALVHLTDILHPAWSRVRSIAVIAGNLGALAVIWLLVRGGEPLVAAVADRTPEQAAKIALWLDRPAHIVLYVIAAACAVQIVIEAMRRSRTPG